MERFEGALYAVGEGLRKTLFLLSPDIKACVQEIRLRVNRPVALTIESGSLYVNTDSTLSKKPCSNSLIARKTDIDESFRLICGCSVYAHTEELKQGFVIMKNGNRAGVCGTLSEQGMMHSISSLNIRIAREILGVADELASKYTGGGLLIAGPPGSGKTTLLRDFIRTLSEIYGKRIAVIDSRGEISGSFTGIFQNDLGCNTDILLTSTKTVGIDIALRTMFPQMIAFDEVGTVDELESIKNCFNCGADIITTAHISSPDDLLSRSVTQNLIKSGAISLIAVLPPKFGEKITFLKPEDLII